MTMTIDSTFILYFLVGLMVIAALWTVLTPTLLRSAIGLACTSAVLTVALFLIGAPLAGVFELSVCAGLITVVFISTISLTTPLTSEDAKGRVKAHRKSFLPLIALVGWLGILLWIAGYTLTGNAPYAAGVAHGEGARELLWSTRRLDLLGQIIIVFAGVFGVVIFFKEKLEVTEEKPKSPEEISREKIASLLKARKSAENKQVTEGPSKPLKEAAK